MLRIPAAAEPPVQCSVGLCSRFGPLPCRIETPSRDGTGNTTYEKSDERELVVRIEFRSIYAAALFDEAFCFRKRGVCQPSTQIRANIAEDQNCCRNEGEQHRSG